MQDFIEILNVYKKQSVTRVMYLWLIKSDLKLKLALWISFLMLPFILALPVSFFDSLVSAALCND